jgi:hypothetical protein
VVDALRCAVARLNLNQVDWHRSSRRDFRVAGHFAISEREFDKSRFAIFLSLVVVGLVAEAAWMFWADQHPVSQWPVHGFQESYVGQLKLKNGNNPELGMATWQDVLKRPLENEGAMATLFAHKQIAPA